LISQPTLHTMTACYSTLQTRLQHWSTCTVIAWQAQHTHWAAQLTAIAGESFQGSFCVLMKTQPQLFSACPSTHRSKCGWHLSGCHCHQSVAVCYCHYFLLVHQQTNRSAKFWQLQQRVIPVACVTSTPMPHYATPCVSTRTTQVLFWHSMSPVLRLPHSCSCTPHLSDLLHVCQPIPPITPTFMLSHLSVPSSSCNDTCIGSCSASSCLCTCEMMDQAENTTTKVEALVFCELLDFVS
jgi:hypothetical protein